MNADVKLTGPYAISEGPSFIQFGHVLDYVRDNRKFGRTQITNGQGEAFHLVLYDDMSWRITTPQLSIFPTEDSHTLT